MHVDIPTCANKKFGVTHYTNMSTLMRYSIFTEQTIDLSII
jgi:hypothetical protein